MILVGRGKTTLTDFFLENNDQGFITIHPSKKGLTTKQEIKIKENPELKFVIHDSVDKLYNGIKYKLSPGIRRRCLVFKLEL